MMAWAGIDISQFKAHSTRAASTSAAAASGVPMKDILKTANWSRESTFQKFYLKPRFEHALSCTQAYHDIELSVSQGSIKLM